MKNTTSFKTIKAIMLTYIAVTILISVYLDTFWLGGLSLITGTFFILVINGYMLKILMSE